MGLFSGKTVYNFEAVSGKLIDEYPDPILEAVTAAVYREGSIPNFIVASILDNFNINMKKYLRYGQTKYARGMPEGSFTYGRVPTDITKAAIEQELPGKQVVIESVTTRSPMLRWWGYKHMQENFPTWNPVDRSYTDSKGVKWFLMNIGDDSKVISDPHTNFPIYTTPATRLIITVRRSTPIFIGGAYHTFIGRLKESSMPPLPKDDPWIHVRYRYAGDPANAIRYWYYDPTSGKHPVLDAWFRDTQEHSEYYPVVPLRIDRNWVNSDKFHNGISWKERYHYESSKKLLKRLDLDIDELIEAVGKDDEDEDVKEIDDINDVFFQFGLDIYTEEEPSIRYLYQFFNQLSKQAATSKSEYDHWRSVVGDDHSSAPQDGFTVTESDYVTSLRWSYIEVTQEIGALENEYEKELKYIAPYEYAFEETDGASSVTIRKVKDIRSFVLLKMRTGKNSFTQVKIKGLYQRHVIEGYDRKRAVYRYIDPAFINPGEKDEEHRVGKSAFFIPLSHIAMQDMPMKDQELVALDAMMLTINAVNKTKLKWYETGIFRALLQAVMIAFSIFMFVWSGGMASYISASLWDLAMMFLAGYGLNYAIELLIQHMGDAGLILAIVLAVAASFVSLKGGISLKGLPFAEQLMSTAQAIVKVVNTYTSVGLEQIERDMTDLIETAEERQEDIDDANDLLTQDHMLNPLFIVGYTSMLNTDEQPSEFYERTIHNGNPGVLSLDAIQGFHENALTLPTTVDEEQNDFLIA